MEFAFEGKTYQIQEENILYSDFLRDLVIFQVPELTTPNYVQVSEDISSQSDPVVTIGYPSMVEHSTDGWEKLYVSGTIEDIGGLNDIPINVKDAFLQVESTRRDVSGMSWHDKENYVYYEIHSYATGGNSGGGSFNENGELIGVLSSGAHNQDKSFVTVFDFRDEELMEVLETIRGTYRIRVN